MIRNERGFTLAEVIASALIVVLASIALYIGIVHVEKQITRNYHERVALMHASGELDWQRYNIGLNHAFLAFQNKSVPIDIDGEKRIDGIMTFELKGIVPPDIVLENISYDILEIRVKWTEPSDKKERDIVVREDFY
ncbi:MAG: hypothetical protein P9L91_00690 [Candidatus Zophobacter franzmannii]|nr:hypothetical protein [Candidatus Zophobacter franzmannii]